MVVWTASAVAGSAAGVAATCLAWGGGSGGTVETDAAAGVAAKSLTLGGGSGGASATGAAAGVAATGLTLGGELGGGSRHLTLLMLSVAVLFYSFPRIYEASIWVHLGRGVVTFSTTLLYHLVSQFLPKRRLY